MSQPNYEVRDESDLKKYRTEVPNVVFDIGLDPYELALYLHLKRTAGARDGGACTKSTTTLARETGMSRGKVSEVKGLLERPRESLGGKALIRVRSAGPGQASDCITLSDIWPENFAFFGSRKSRDCSPHERDCSPHERDCSPHERDCSRGEPKKELNRKEPFRKERLKEGRNAREQIQSIHPSAPLADISSEQAPQPARLEPEPALPDEIVRALRQVTGYPLDTPKAQQELPGVVAFVLDMAGGDIDEAARHVRARFETGTWPKIAAPWLSQIAPHWERQGKAAAYKAAKETDDGKNLSNPRQSVPQRGLGPISHFAPGLTRLRDRQPAQLR